MANQLQPVHPPMGPNLAYCVGKTTILAMKEKIWTISGGDFDIRDENDQTVVKCKGRAMSISNRREFSTADNRPLLSLRSKIISVRKSFYGEGLGGETLFEVKSKWSRMYTSFRHYQVNRGPDQIGTVIKPKMHATFTNASNGQAVELEVRGDWLDRSATITNTQNGQVVAQIGRSYFNMREILGGQQTVRLTA
jgi:uncharacterized protein YxjI